AGGVRVPGGLAGVALLGMRRVGRATGLASAALTGLAGHLLVRRLLGLLVADLGLARVLRVVGLRALALVGHTPGIPMRRAFPTTPCRPVVAARPEGRTAPASGRGLRAAPRSARPRGTRAADRIEEKGAGGGARPARCARSLS